MKKNGAFRRALAVGYPFLLPLAALVVWIVTQSRGQINDPTPILASIDPSGNGTAYLSTVISDGAQAIWECSSGTFVESGENTASGRSVTWRADPGFSDSVTVWITTPSAADSISFLPVIREVTPSITVSSAYHLAILDRSRSVSLPAGSYTVTVLNEGLSGYDGLTVLILNSPGGTRRGWVVFPGDSLAVDLPLGADFEAVVMDDLEGALDNSGAIMIRFFRESRDAPVADREDGAGDIQAGTTPDDEIEEFYEE